jgi:DNA repair exonuclease SbcCD nuclease subunit
METPEQWFKTQKMQLEYISDMAHGRHIPIVIGGDIFHRPVISDSYKNMFLDVFAAQTLFIIAGQHVLENHNLDDVNSTSFGVISKMPNIHYPGSIGMYAHFNEEVSGTETGLYFLHRLVFADKKSMPPTDKAITAEQILDEYPNAKWIFLGDVHNGFHYENKGRHVLMAGSMNRQRSDMIDYKPVIWEVDTSTGKVEPIFIPDDVTVVTDRFVAERDRKLNSFTGFVKLMKDHLKDGQKVTLDYRENVEIAMATTEGITEGVIAIAREMMDE